MVPRVAFEVAHRINAATPITPAALVTFGLLDNDGRAMTLAETLAVLEPLVAYVRRRQLPLTADVDLGRPEGLRKALATLVREGVVVEYAGGLEPVYAIAPDRQHEAAFYRNTVTHYFIDRAILEVALVQAADEDAAADVDVVAATWTRALALRDLLKYEFFFATKREFDTQLRYETDLVRPGWAEESADTERDHRAALGLPPAAGAPGDRTVPGGLLRGGRPVGHPGARGAAGRRRADRREPRGRPPAVAAAGPALAGVDLQGPDGRRAQARRQPRPARARAATTSSQSRQHFADELAAAVEAIAVVRSLALKD